MENAIIIDDFKTTDFVYQTSGCYAEKYMTISHIKTGENIMQAIDTNKPEYPQRQLLLLKLIVQVLDKKSQ